MERYREYIHIEKCDFGKLIIETHNVSGKDVIHFFAAYIETVSKKENIPSDVFLNLIHKELNKKEADNNEETESV